jgi:hypothetical protein
LESSSEESWGYAEHRNEAVNAQHCKIIQHEVKKQKSLVSLAEVAALRASATAVTRHEAEDARRSMEFASAARARLELLEAEARFHMQQRVHKMKEEKSPGTTNESSLPKARPGSQNQEHVVKLDAKFRWVRRKTPKGRWSSDEEGYLLQLVAKPLCWKDKARLLNAQFETGRTETELKMRWRQMMETGTLRWGSDAWRDIDRRVARMARGIPTV